MDKSRLDELIQIKNNDKNLSKEELDKINYEINWIENFLYEEEVFTNKMLEELYDYEPLDVDE